MTKVKEFEVVEQGPGGKRFVAKSVTPSRKDRTFDGGSASEQLASFFLVATGEELLRVGDKFRGRDTDRMFLIPEDE